MDTELVPGARIGRNDARVLVELRKLGLPLDHYEGEPRFLKLGNEHGEYYRIIVCKDDMELAIVKAAIARAGFSTPAEKLIEPQSRGPYWLHRVRNWFHRI